MPLPVGVPDEIFGYHHQPNREQLEKLIAQFSIQSVIEIGSFLGQSAAWFAARVASVTCVDSFRLDAWNEPDMTEVFKLKGIPGDFYPIFEAGLKAMGVWEKIHVVRGDSVAAASQVLPADLLYIDGCHTYEACRADIAAYRSKARWVICGDDYLDRPEYGVIRAVNEAFPGRQTYGPFWWVEQ